MSPEGNDSAGAHPDERASLDPVVLDALTELNARIAQQGVRARVYVHQGMTAVMVHRDGDTAATIDQALEDGPEVVGELAAEIASELGLPEDWLNRLGSEAPAVSAPHRLTIRERSLHRVLRTAARLAERCVTVARQPDAYRLKKRVAFAGVRVCRAIVSLSKRFADSGRTKPRRCCDTLTRRWRT